MIISSDCVLDGLDKLDVLLGHIGLRQVVRLSVLYSSRRPASDPTLGVHVRRDCRTGFFVCLGGSISVSTY